MGGNTLDILRFDDQLRFNEDRGASAVGRHEVNHGIDSPIDDGLLATHLGGPRRGNPPYEQVQSAPKDVDLTCRSCGHVSDDLCRFPFLSLVRLRQNN